MDNNKNRFVIFFLIIFISAITIVNFLFFEPKYKITIEIIICFALLIILALSEVFDNLSIPKIISLSRNVNKIKKENDELKELNIKLIQQVANINNSVNTTNKFIITGSSSIEDMKNNYSFGLDENDKRDDISYSNNKSFKELSMNKYLYMNGAEEFILKKALKEDNENKSIESEIQYGATLDYITISNTKNIQGKFRFDAIKSNKVEDIFYEIKLSSSTNYLDQLQKILEIIELYKAGSSKKCKLVLVLPIVDNELENTINSSLNHKIAIMKKRVLDVFDEYIKDNLLEIAEINVSKKELDEYIAKKNINKISKKI